MPRNNQFIPPQSDQLEISVFGPGYGEAVLVHVGEGKWILIDSCIDPVSNRPASLEYLNSLGVSASESVKLIVATHWHDDHVRGISTVFSVCESATIAMSDALRHEEFGTLAILYRLPVMLHSGIDELARVFQVLESRKQRGARFNPPKLAVADKLLLSDRIRVSDEETVDAKVFALSPSDASVLQARLAFAQLLPKPELDTGIANRRRVASPTPNFTSVVLWLEVGSHKILLGADLENVNDPKAGWSVIVSESAVVNGKANVFKIPHHGSKNAHNDRVWSDLLAAKPLAVLTPFGSGKKPLPSPADILRITSLTDHAYITAPSRYQKLRWRNRVVGDTLAQATRSVHRINNGWGHVRLRRQINDLHGSWSIELFGKAHRLSKSSIPK